MQRGGVTIPERNQPKARWHTGPPSLVGNSGTSTERTVGPALDWSVIAAHAKALYG
jgi:hypothetical protein